MNQYIILLALGTMKAFIHTNRYEIPPIKIMHKKIKIIKLMMMMRMVIIKINYFFLDKTKI
jgi:hypothetical protein